MRHMLLAVACVAIASVSTANQTEPVCEQPPFAEVQSAVVSLTFRYSKPDENGSGGKRANGVFLSPTTIATGEHVSEVLERTNQEVTLGFGDEADGTVKNQILASVVKVELYENGLSEKFSIIELRDSVSGVRAARVRSLTVEPLSNNEPIVGVYYQSLVRYEVFGWHRKLGRSLLVNTEKRENEPFLLFQFASQQDGGEVVLEQGMSAGSIFDCDGRLVSLIEAILGYSPEEIRKAKSPERLPNITGIPIELVFE